MDILQKSLEYFDQIKRFITLLQCEKNHSQKPFEAPADKKIPPLTNTPKPGIKEPPSEHKPIQALKKLCKTIHPKTLELFNF